MISRRKLLCVLAVLLVGTGCGDDGSLTAPASTSGATRAPSEASYRGKVNALCRDAKRVSEQIEAEASDAADPIAPLVRLVKTTERYNLRFERLTPPSSLARQHAAAIRDAAIGERLFGTLLEDLRAGKVDEATFRGFIRKLQPVFERSNQRSKAMGLDDCVSKTPLATF